MRLLFTFFLSISVSATGQFYLKPHIGQSSIPQNTTAICTIPTYTGNFNTTGLQAGDTCFDFTLFSTMGDTLSLSNELAAGLPVLLVNGSYTCPVFRNKVNMINQVASTYNGLIKVFVVYTVEAHPTNISPYFGYVNTTNANQNLGILYTQPTTYLDRKNIVDDMLQAMTINPTVYLDGPCNEWWSTYGPAPNNAYLINTDGSIFAKHPWFDKNPIDYILCDIDSLLYNTPCTQGAGNGNFSINQKDTLILGSPGSILYGFTDLINPSPNPINVMAVKMQKNYALPWQTAFCADVCYTPAEDTIFFAIPANDTMHFSIDFITGTVPDSGNIRIGLRNMNNSSNQFAINVYAKTNGPNAITAKQKKNFVLYPNPSSSTIVLKEYGEKEIEILSPIGKRLHKVKLPNQTSVHKLDLSFLPKGIYFIGSRRTAFQKLIIQ